MDSELLCDFWETVKEYIPAKDKQTAADHIITNLVDSGISDEILNEMKLLDKNMAAAVAEHIEEDDDEDPEWSEDY